MVIDMNYWLKVLYRVIILVISIAVIFLSLKLAIYYIPFLIAFIISTLIEPIIKWTCSKNNFTRKTNAVIVMLIVFSILLCLISFAIVKLVVESYNLLQNSNVYMDKIYSIWNKIDLNKINLPEQISEMLKHSADKIIGYFNEFTINLLTKFLNSLKELPIIGIYIVITILATYFICSERFLILDQLEHHFPNILLKKIRYKMKNIINSLGNYLKAEAILILISFIEVLIGLYLFKILGLGIKFPFIMALLTGFVDALPILGSGSVLIPWAIVSASNGNVSLGIAIFSLYVIVLIIRQLLEPKIVSNKLGIHPIFTLIAMYTGFRISGIIGLIIGPIILIILKEVFSNMIDDGIVKNILNR